MKTNNSNKKITKVSEGASENVQSRTFVPTDEAKGKANRLRLIAIISWVVAVAAQLVAISLLFKDPINMTWLIVLIVVDLIFVVIGSILWKKSNRLDPASEENKFKFFMQNQLGLVVAIIAFLPLIILIFTNKNMDGKQKGIVGGIAVLALLIAGVTGIDFNPPSIEQYTEQTNKVEWLNQGANNVYWTKSGTVYHLFIDCSYINTAKTSEIFEGTVAQSRELKNITNLCSRCENKAIKERNLDEAEYNTDPELTD
ncbi:hypothetical protein [Paucihalobacter sp.]|uniref:hypothetical protein n=1 Tax=Paucihalobacter sp. TaxID=2850405 RepID=UPI002FDF24DC